MIYFNDYNDYNKLFSHGNNIFLVDVYNNFSPSRAKSLGLNIDQSVSPLNIPTSVYIYPTNALHQNLSIFCGSLSFLFNAPYQSKKLRSYGLSYTSL